MNNPSPQTAAARLNRISRLRPKLATVLGCGFHHVLTALCVDTKIPYAQIPGFPIPGVSGHTGELFFGRFGSTPVLVLSGRAHFYERYAMEQVTFPIRTLAELSIRDLLLTSTAGGINKNFRVGDFMVLIHHISLMGLNPLRPGAMPGPQFVDMTQVYDPGLNVLLFRAGKRGNLKLHRGIYLAVSGPSYETPAEIRAFVRLGADAVGMSTAPEATVARQCGLNVAAVSRITNPAAGLRKGKFSHFKVLEIAKKGKSLAVELLKNFMRPYGKTDQARRFQAAC